MKMYEFIGSEFELDIKRQEKIRCKVWEPKENNNSVVVLAYGYGDNADSEKWMNLANQISINEKMAVVLVEYAGTNLKYSEKSIENLQDLLPNLLDKISDFTPNNVKELIQNNKYQDAINELYFNAFINYPVSTDTLIPLYGDENSYNDFGLAPALDIIYSIISLKEMYSTWDWNDCIGFGKDYGAYLIEMVERIQPGTFSFIMNIQGNIAPEQEDLFYNLVEWENGNQRNAHIKKIGRFPIFIVEKQGWTTNPEHENYFAPHNFDIRNLSNKLLIKSSFNHLNTPRIYVDVYNLNPEYLNERKMYIDSLIESGYSLEYFLVEKQDIDGYVFKQFGEEIDIDLYKLFNYYMKNEYVRNTDNKESEELIWYPVNNGAYIIYKDVYPKVKYINKSNLLIKENEFIYNLINNSTSKEAIIDAIMNYKDEVDDNYRKLID